MEKSGSRGRTLATTTWVASARTARLPTSRPRPISGVERLRVERPTSRWATMETCGPHSRRGKSAFHDDEHMSYSVEMESSRRCSECGRTFQPSSRHKRCPACSARSQGACGRPKHTNSVVCGACRLDARESNGNWKGG